MRILKSHPLLKLINSYLIDSSQPSNISYMWNFGSLLGVCLVIQIVTGVTLAMHVRCGNRTMSYGSSILVVPKAEAKRSSELGNGESPKPNIAFQLKALVDKEAAIWNTSARSNSPRGETQTSQTLITTALKLRGAASSYSKKSSMLTPLRNMSAGFLILGRITDSSTRWMKVMDCAPNRDKRTLHLNTWLPKGGNSYGNGTLWVPSSTNQLPRGSAHFLRTMMMMGWRGGRVKRIGGRSVALLFLQRRRTTSYLPAPAWGAAEMEWGKSTTSSRNKLASLSKSNPSMVELRNLYNLLTSPQALTLAYERLLHCDLHHHLPRSQNSLLGIMTCESRSKPPIGSEIMDNYISRAGNPLVRRGGISKETIRKLSAKLRNETFSFTPSPLLRCPGDNPYHQLRPPFGSTTPPSPLARPHRSSPRPTTPRMHISSKDDGDKPADTTSTFIVLEAIHLALDGIYEPLFVDSSPLASKGCQTTQTTPLKKVSKILQTVQWVIQGELAKETISLKKVMDILENQIRDRKFTNLIWKALKAGYFDFRKPQNSFDTSSMAGGGWPAVNILANIYLSQTLDPIILKLKKEFERAERTKEEDLLDEWNPQTYSKESRSSDDPWLKGRREGESHGVKSGGSDDDDDYPSLRMSLSKRKWRKVASPVPSNREQIQLKRRLVYVRYAVDWIIGIRGSRSEAEIVKKKVSSIFSQTSIERSPTGSSDHSHSQCKTKLTHINCEPILFLGTKISRQSSQISSRRQSGSSAWRITKRNKLGGIRLEAPMDIIRKKLTQSSFISRGKSAPKFSWLRLEHDQIILLYNAVLRGFLNYYNFVHNYHRLVSYLGFILKQSCAKLLATKFNLGTMAKCYKKFGPNLKGPKGKTILIPLARRRIRGDDDS